MVNWLWQTTQTDLPIKATQRRLAEVSLLSDQALPEILKNTVTPDRQTVLLHPAKKQPQVTNASPAKYSAPARVKPIKKPHQGVSLASGPAVPILSAPPVHASAPLEKDTQPPLLAHEERVASSVSIASAVASLPKSVKFPQHLRITYTAGPIPAELEWKMSQGQYTMTLHTMAFVNMAYISQGYVTEEGLQPSQFQEKRKGQLKYQVDFDWQNQTVLIGEPDQQSVETLKTGDQDMFSAGFQLAVLGSRFKEFAFSVATSRKWYPNVSFAIEGETKIQIGEKWVDALLLKGQHDNKTFEFWLAPDWGNIPVRINIDTDKGNYTMTAIRVVAEGKVLAEPVSQLNQQSTGYMKER
jgi:hypothetical protein